MSKAKSKHTRCRVQHKALLDEALSLATAAAQETSTAKRDALLRTACSLYFLAYQADAALVLSEIREARS